MDLTQEDLFYSLKNTYNSIYRINLRNNTAFEVFSREYVRNSVGSSSTVVTATELARAQVKNLVRPEWQEAVAAFCDITSISDRLKNTDQLFIEYESVFKGWQRQSIVAYKRDPVTNEAIEIFYTTQIIDDERQEELALLHSLKKTLKTLNSNDGDVPSVSTLRAQRSAALAFATQSTNRDQSSFMAPDARILAVDDVEDNLKVITSLLRRTGIQVDIAGGGNEALELTAKNKYHLIIMDHMMPDPDGIATRELIAKDESNPNHDTPVIMLTANALVGVRDEYLAHGFVDYIAKPVESKILEEVVKRNLPAELIHEKDIENIPAAAAPSFDASVVTAKTPLEDNSSSSEIDAKISALKALNLNIDVDTSVEKYTGSEDFYLELLINWCKEDRIGRMSEHLSSEDLKKYRLEAHSLKGTSRALGITKVADIAEALQNSCDSGTIVDVKKLHAEVVNELLEIKTKISQIIL